jgi:nitrite reductase/ring-hydroxylating ferredoxin subunit
VELRVDAGPPDVGSIGVVIGGQTVPVLVHWGRFDGTSGETVSPTAIADATTIRSIRLELPSGSAPETRVWSHRVEVDGGSALWPADAAIVRDGARYPLLLDADGLAAGDAGPGPSTVVIERSLPRGRSDA